VNVALLGCGWIAAWGHGRAIPGVDSWNVVAVADPDLALASQVGAQFNLAPDRCLGDLKDLLTLDEVELICVLTPPSLHREHVEAIAAAGRHIACEKPFALTLADADAMLEAAAAAGVVLSVFHNHIYVEEHQLARRLIDQGAIGDVEGLVINGLGSRPWSGSEGWHPEWRRTPTLSGGGALIDSGLHALYLTEHYFGTSPSWVSAVTDPPIDLDRVETYAYVHLGFPNGVASVGSGWGGGPAHFEIFGRERRICMDFHTTDGYFGAQPKSVQVVAGEKIIEEFHLPDRDFQLFTPALYDAIEQRVRDPRSGFRISGEQGREALELVLASYASAVRGHVVQLPLRRDDPVYAGGLLALGD
jgi:predicted dehydrogenase